MYVHVYHKHNSFPVFANVIESLLQISTAELEQMAYPPFSCSNVLVCDPFSPMENMY